MKRVFTERLRGVVLARQYLMMEYDCPKTVKDAAVKITPGLQAPTISPLDDDNWVAVRSMVKRTKANRVMDQLAALGAQGHPHHRHPLVPRAQDERARTDLQGSGPARVGRRHPVPRRAERLVAAPRARRPRVRPEVAGAARAADRGPDRVQGAGEPAQLRLVRGVAQLLGAGQVQQPQLGGHHPAQAQQRQRVELHLEQRACLGDGARRTAGLVVDHADRGAVRTAAVDPVDVPAQQQPRLQLDLDEQLPGLGFEQPRVFEGEVGVEERLGAREPARDLRTRGLGGRRVIVGGRAGRSSARVGGPCRRRARPRRRTARRGAGGRRRTAAPRPGATSARAACGVRCSAGSRNSRSSTACTSVPRACAGLGTSGSRSIARKR